MNDRLPDWAYTDEELAERASEVMDRDSGIDRELGRIASYRLIGKKGDTGKRMLMWSHETMELEAALSNEWADTGLKVWLADNRVAWRSEYTSLLEVLDKWKYKPKFDRIAADKVYTWEPWMNELIKD